MSLTLEQLERTCAERHLLLDKMQGERDQRYMAERQADRLASEHRYDRLQTMVLAADQKASNPDLSKGFLSVPAILTVIAVVVSAAGLWFAAENGRNNTQHQCNELEKRIVKLERFHEKGGR